MQQNPEVYSCEHEYTEWSVGQTGPQTSEDQTQNSMRWKKKLPLIAELINQMSCDWRERSRRALRCTYRTLPRNLISFKYLAARL